jgi:hypothetical protein
MRCPSHPPFFAGFEVELRDVQELTQQGTSFHGRHHARS